MAPAGLAAMALARTTGMWHAHADIEALVVPPELQRALDADPDAKRHWPTYSESARKGFLFMLANARRPETRDRRAREIVDLVSRKVSMTELRKAAMTGTRPEPRSPARRKRSS
jgi:uncharacterized protein YdeI (YjbR/CyaY-like superfamily)